MTKKLGKKDEHYEQKITELTNDVQRIQAEFINYKNRTEVEKQTLAEFAKMQVVKDLLPVIDDLERALAHAPKELKNNKWAEGVVKVHDRLMKQLEKMNIVKIEALHQPFDPNLHEAIQAEGEGGHQIVSEVLQNGYRIDDRVIRHAMVRVSHQ